MKSSTPIRQLTFVTDPAIWNKATQTMSTPFLFILLSCISRSVSFQPQSPNRWITTRTYAKIVQDAEEYQFVTPETSHNDLKDDYVVRAGAGIRIEQSPSLVLNADYTPLSHLPLSLWSWQDTLRAVFSGKAVVVSEYKDLLVRSVSCTFPLPSVIVLKSYQKMPNQVPVMSRRNLYIRDGFKCQVHNIYLNVSCIIYLKDRSSLMQCVSHHRILVVSLRASKEVPYKVPPWKPRTCHL